MQGGFDVAALVLVAVAALWLPGRRFLGTSVGISTAYLGVVSWAWHPTPGSFNHTWSIMCIMWGASVALLSLTATAEP